MGKLTFEGHQADIFEVGPRVADVLVTFGRIGLNVWNISLHGFVERWGDQLTLPGGHSPPKGIGNWNPWNQCHSTLLPLDPPAQQLRWLYFMANEDGAHGLDDAAARRATRDAFEAVVAGATGPDLSVAYSGIGDPNGNDDGRVRLLVEVISDWHAQRHPELDLTVHLVTTGEGFVMNVP